MDSHKTTNPLMLEFVSLSSDVLLWLGVICYTSYRRLDVTIVTKMNQNSFMWQTSFALPPNFHVC